MAQAASQIKKRAIVDTSVEDEKLAKRKIRQAQRQLKKKVLAEERDEEERRLSSAQCLPWSSPIVLVGSLYGALQHAGGLRSALSAPPL
ncbi:hypothetical protein DPEC_G00032220 [Dallia pectoralis]|uniref:Uncharacterized protein n=1 Tax=Dallia pectoralis TaxID=75939 RepID=A0ACC2HD89_DALPE|nr:hypothetical protein DPEC_G00032220 [Dallia pectoralis]